MHLSTTTLACLLPFLLGLPQVNGLASGTGKTTRYWDCCKPSCSWPKKAALAVGAVPVLTCDAHDNPLSDGGNTKSACDGGTAYMCSNESPWAISEDVSYGFAATNIAGGNEASWCCACYELTFTSGPVAGKKFIIQSTNTGGDLGSNQFDLSMPGGGFGIFNGCSKEYGNPAQGWGQTYGGISKRSQCDDFPEKLKAGCYWRFDWFKAADNPAVTFKQVTCPAALTAKSGCVRAGEVPTGPSSMATWTSGMSTPTSAPVVVPTIPVVIPTTMVNSTIIAPSVTPVTPVAPSTAPVGTVPQYGQCGGLGYSGPTGCVAGMTCQAQNSYYSQCL